MSNHPSHRDSIFLEDATILQHVAYADRQYVLRVTAPQTAARAKPGTFAHITCSADIPMRRPLSIMRTDPAGWIEFLYKPIGRGLEALSQRKPGESISVLGPIGNGFTLDADRPRILALGGGVGIPPMIFVAQALRGEADYDLTVFMGSEIAFPLDLSEAIHHSGGINSEGMYASALLNSWGTASHLASNSGIKGAHPGYVTELAAALLKTLPASERDQTQIIACGPEPMLKASAALAQQFSVPCELALEEFMACGVGGCAGCTVLTRGPDGDAMKRVCVDGPVFPAEQIYFAAAN